jgi:transposase
MPELYLFIESTCESSIPEFKSFAKGLLRDMNAVENAVASDLSNGFVEGTNNKLKTIKRTMYGRCSRKLLSAKMMLT